MNVFTVLVHDKKPTTGEWQVVVFNDVPAEHEPEAFDKVLAKCSAEALPYRCSEISHV